jgi:hypothetical protein
MNADGRGFYRGHAMNSKYLYIAISIVILLGCGDAVAADWQLISSTCKEPLAVAQYLKNTGAVAAGSTVQTPDIPAPITTKIQVSEPLRIAIVAGTSGKVDCFELWGKTGGPSANRDGVTSEISSGLKQWEFKPVMFGPKLIPAHYWFFLKEKDGQLVALPAPMRIKGFSPED